MLYRSLQLHYSNIFGATHGYVCFTSGVGRPEGVAARKKEEKQKRAEQRRIDTHAPNTTCVERLEGVTVRKREEKQKRGEQIRIDTHVFNTTSVIRLEGVTARKKKEETEVEETNAHQH